MARALGLSATIRTLTAGLALSLGIAAAPAIADGPGPAYVAPEPVVVEQDLTRRFLGAHRDGRVTLGFARLFTNDFLGDGEDRWRSGSYQISQIYGPVDAVTRPVAIGEMIEFRYAARILSPANTVTPAADDRRFAGILELGAYSHSAPGPYELSFGAGATLVGPSTGVGRFQDAFHREAGLNVISPAVYNNQFADAAYIGASAELARPVWIGDRAMLRPYAAVAAGPETYVRAGADFVIGSNFTRGVLTRDETTGTLYQTLEDETENGFSFLIGGDVTKTFSDVFLPANEGYVLTPARLRLRAGATTRLGPVSTFYGVTWLGREFEAQPEGQILGAVQIQIAF